MLGNNMFFFRELDLLNSVVRVGFDERQGSLKIIMNVFDTTALHFQLMYTRVNKMIILVIT